MIEMLVAITIMLIVFSLTAGVVSLAINTDRIPSSARSVQAAILGARDRAVRAGKAELNPQSRRGVRFVLMPNQPKAVGSLVYIGNQDDWTTGQISVTAGSKNFTGVDWSVLTGAGVSLTGARIKILDSGGSWYRLASSTEFTRPYDPVGASNSYNYRLQLPSTILPNEQPILLDSNVVVNLDISADHQVIPSNWSNITGSGTLSPMDDPFVYSSYNQSAMEIEFNPNGGVHGPLASNGPIYLYLCTIDDFLAERVSPADRRSLPKGRDPADPERGDALILKINPQTGQVQSFPVDPTDQYRNSTLPKYAGLPDYAGPPDATPDGLADNPFRIAQQQ